MVVVLVVLAAQATLGVVASRRMVASAASLGVVALLVAVMLVV